MNFGFGLRLAENAFLAFRSQAMRTFLGVFFLQAFSALWSFCDMVSGLLTVTAATPVLPRLSALGIVVMSG